MPTATPISRVNDFVVRFANVNGSGSASANEMIARAVLRMGIPAAPRNIFPSNIQGLPTWYEVRVTEAGHLGARLLQLALQHFQIGGSLDRVHAVLLDRRVGREVGGSLLDLTQQGDQPLQILDVAEVADGEPVIPADTVSQFLDGAGRAAGVVAARVPRAVTRGTPLVQGISGRRALRTSRRLDPRLSPRSSRATVIAVRILLPVRRHDILSMRFGRTRMKGLAAVIFAACALVQPAAADRLRLALECQ